MKANFFEHILEDGTKALAFRLEKPSMADTPEKAIPFVFEGLATPEHIKQYEKAFLDFVEPLITKELEKVLPGEEVVVYGVKAIKAAVEKALGLDEQPKAAEPAPVDVKPADE